MCSRTLDPHLAAAICTLTTKERNQSEMQTVVDGDLEGVSEGELKVVKQIIYVQNVFYNIYYVFFFPVTTEMNLAFPKPCSRTSLIQSYKLWTPL